MDVHVDPFGCNEPCATNSAFRRKPCRIMGVNCVLIGYNFMEHFGVTII